MCRYKSCPGECHSYYDSNGILKVSSMCRAHLNEKRDSMAALKTSRYISAHKRTVPVKDMKSLIGTLI